jgi:hypothetical protein
MLTVPVPSLLLAQSAEDSLNAKSGLAITLCK